MPNKEVTTVGELISLLSTLPKGAVVAVHDNEMMRDYTAQVEIDEDKVTFSIGEEL